MKSLSVSNNFLKLVKNAEGLSLTPYLCPAKVPTIGYGTTIYPDNTKVTLKDKPITKELAHNYLMNDVIPALKLIEKLVKPELSQNQIDALVDFIYNVGPGNFKASTLLKKINANVNDETIADEFKKWNKATVNGVKKILVGLTDRRKAEADLWNT